MPDAYRVAVTGGAGYLGSALCTQLLADGHSVTAVDCLRFGGASLLHLLGHERFRFVPGDIRSAAVRNAALEGADAVVHLAAIVGDPACAAEPETAVAVNRDASRALLEAAAAAGVQRFIFASTCSNYGKMADTGVLATESHELRPVSLYAETKVEFERELLSRNHATLCPTVLRFATLYGLSARMRFDLTVNQFAREMHETGRVTIFGEQFWRPYVHVRDAALAIRTVLRAARAVVGGEVFNVGATEQNFRKADIVDMVQARLRRPAEVIRVARDEDPRDYRVSFDRIADRLGFAPRHTVAEGIDEIVTACEDGIFGTAATAPLEVAR